MHIKYTVKTMDEIIGYWIEAAHISSELSILGDYVDEAAELYEGAQWLEGDDSQGLMSVVASIDESSSYASALRFQAETKLSGVLEAAISAGADKFEKYADIDIQDKMEDILQALYMDFDNIYAYTQSEQIENFYKVLFGILDEVITQ